MLLFSCNGRGTSLYNEPSWDSRTLAGYIPVPVSGFMCNGEGVKVGSGGELVGHVWTYEHKRGRGGVAEWHGLHPWACVVTIVRGLIVGVPGGEIHSCACVWLHVQW
jgi:hypothetical protein